MAVDIALFLRGVRIVAAVAVAVATGYAVRYRNERVSAAFIWTVAAVAVWGWLTMLPGVVDGRPVTGNARAAISLAAVTAGSCAIVCWFVYIRRYTGHRQYGTRRRVAAMFAPVAVAMGARLLMATTLTVQGWPVSSVLAVVYATMYLYLAALFVLGAYLLFRLAQRYRQVPLTQVAVLGVAIAAPNLTVFVSALTRPVQDGTTVSVLPVDISSLGFLVSAFAFSYAIHTYSLFTTFPESEYVARDEVLEDLTESMFILDPADRVLDMNTAATGLCRQPAEDVIGQPITAIFDGLSHIPADGVQRTTLQTPDGPREFEISASALQDGEGARLGTTLLARDITAKTTREQQLAVLTRILRHNLRNNVDTALAHTTEIADPEVRAAIRSQLHSLADLSTKAGDIDEVIARAHEPRSEIDVVAVVDAVTDQLAADYDCELAVTAPDELPLVSHRWLLSRLLTEVIENAITHTEQPVPHVDVTVTNPDPDSPITIDITDNGPGIPAHERTAIHGETETPLAHSSGVGLWLASWIAESLDGDLSIEQPDGAGTTVRVTLWAKSTSA